MSEDTKKHKESVIELSQVFNDAVIKHFPKGRVDIDEVCVSCATVMVGYLIQIPDTQKRQVTTAKIISIIANMVAQRSV